MSYIDWKDFFNKLNFTYFRTSLIQRKYIETIEQLVLSLKKRKTTILEVAAGSAYTSVVLADLFKKDNVTVIASDLEPSLVYKARSTFDQHENIVFAVQDSMDISYDDKSIDVIIHQGFLEHFEDDQIVSFLKEQSRVAKFIVFDVPNSLRDDKSQEFGNERFLHPLEWCDLVERAGLFVYLRTGRRFNNWWKKYVPLIIRDTEWFQRCYGESTIIVCGR